MLNTILETVLYYGVAAIFTTILILVVSLFLGGSGEIIAVVSCIVLVTIFEFSIYEILIFSIILNIMWVVTKQIFNNRKYNGEWHDKNNKYILIIEELENQLIVKANFINDFSVQIKNKNIVLTSSDAFCTIKKGLGNCLHLIIDKNKIKNKIILNQKKIQMYKGFMGIISARQQALLGIILGVIFGIADTLIPINIGIWGVHEDLNFILLVEKLLANIMLYSLYLFGLVFIFNFIGILSGAIEQSIDSIISLSSSIPIFTFILAILVGLFIIGVSIIPGIFIGVKLVLDECIGE